MVGSDDKQLRVFDYGTGELVKTFEVNYYALNCYSCNLTMSITKAHSDYVRTICVHPTRQLVLTGGDDHKIKLWGTWGHDPLDEPPLTQLARL